MTTTSQVADNTARFGPALDRLRQPHAIGGETAIDVRSVAEIHRPFSLLTKVRITTSARRFNAYVKQYRLKEPGDAHLALMMDRVARDYRTTAQLHERLAAAPRFAVPRPLACYSDLLIVVFEESPGDSLYDVISQTARAWPAKHALRALNDHVRSCGEWLRWCHDAHDLPERYSIDGMWEYIYLRLARLAANPRARFSDALHSRVRQFFRGLMSRVASLDLRMTLVHGDFTPGNILVDPSATTVLDWAMAQQGSRYHDLTHFCHQLELFSCKPLFRPGLIDQLRDSFLAGYFRNDARDLELFTAFRILHHVTHFLSLVNAHGAGLGERAYNRWVCRYHLQALQRCTTGPEGHRLCP